MNYRLLHISDVHLERSFAAMGCQGELARRRRQGLRNVLRRAVEEARERGCDAISIGGDLYEHDRSTADTAAFLAELFAEIHPLPVLLVAGNHDPLIRGSLYSRTVWPANVHLFTEPTLQPLELSDGLTVWGLSHQELAWQGDPLAGPPVGGDGGVHLALFHGAEVGSRPEGKSVHGPFAASDIRERGFAAALCGHYHSRRCDHTTGLLYPGTPEPLAFDEAGARGPVIVEVAADGSISFSPLNLNAWTAVSTACDLSSVATTNGAADLVAATAALETTGLDPAFTLLRIDLIGSVEVSIALDAFTLETHLRDLTGVAVARVRDRTTTEVDTAAIAQEATVRGAFARSLLDSIASQGDAAEKAILVDALRYGLEALSGAEVGLR